MTDAPAVRWARDGASARITIDNPGKRNAMTRSMWSQLADAAGELAADPTVRALVVVGGGDHFCAGADIAEFADGRDAEYERVNAAAEDALANFPGPTVAMIRGNCVGGGVSIAMACDIRLAADDAVFGVTPARLGLVYPEESLRRLVSIVGPAAAKHLLLTADLVDATWANEHGLVTRLVPAVDLDRTAESLVAVLLERSSLTQQAMKTMVDEIARHGSVAPATASHWSALSTASGEFAEGVAAFTQRRPAEFPWRRDAR